MSLKMIYTTTETVPGREIREILGVVSGNVVQTKHIGKDLMAVLKSVVGGEITGYTNLRKPDKSHKQTGSCRDRMEADAAHS